MTDQGHTPGPWAVRRGREPDTANSFEIYEAGQEWYHAAVYGDKEERRANAHLIAAAPDGLALAVAVDEWLGQIERGSPMAANAAELLREKARAFIAKARGANEEGRE